MVADPPSPAPTEPAAQPGVVRIAAIGASAGGLEATSRLFDALPADTGLAFIVVQHFDPNHPSLLPALLGEHTAMPVAEATDGGTIEPDHVYVIPPGHYLAVRAGALHLSAPDAHHGARLPIDFLFASLAQACGPQTAALILSGTGADGSTALAALHRAGATIMAQSPEDAEYPGMPQSAVATGLVDQVLPLAGLAKALTTFAQRVAPHPAAAAPQPDQADDLTAILDHVRDTTGHDFHPYKPGTIARRIARRMSLLAIKPGDLAGYLARLRDEPGEGTLLVGDLLINVTSFFRDAEVYRVLETTILPETLRKLPAGQALRVWVAGCSSGEEAYSIAMICRDAILQTRRDIKLQVFASDIDPDAITTAREGLYPPDIAGQVPAERLARYFLHEETGYRVVPALRGQVVFSVQDVLSDPPFSRIHLITCRNLLIYLNAQAQAKVIGLFHFALRDGGTLVLGTSETPGKADGQFEPIAGSECCYRHVARARTGEAAIGFRVDDRQPLIAPADRPRLSPRHASLVDICTRAVLAHHAPAAVLINRNHECLYSTGPVSRYLRVAAGFATLDLLAMAAPALRTRLRLAINRASRDEPLIDGGRARISCDGATVWFRIAVEALAEPDDDLLLVCFVDEPAPVDPAGLGQTPGDAVRIAELEHELAETQAELQTLIHQREIALQEQKAINEEALSVNEEFQSTNEELLTSKEELQSLNEELTALNSQLQETLDRQRLASDDLQNVLYSTNVGTMFLDANLQIRFFTPAIKPLFNVIPGDIGRPLADLRPIASDPELLGDARRVLSDGATIDREVMAPGDIWFVRRIFPYRAQDSRVEGVVITFADITERKLSTSALEVAKLDAERANVAKSRFLAAASHDLRQPLQVLTLLKEQLSQVIVGKRASDLFGRFDNTLRALSGMLDVLLNINQIEAGAVSPKLARFAISTLFDRLRDEFTHMAHARHLALTVLPSAALVESDPRLLEQMIRNLLGNAIKYTRSGKILLGCRRRGTDLRIEVWDTGIGIEADQLHAVFEEFHQVGNQARERDHGLGLGLAIVQRLGHLLGHGIDVRSVPGKGSVFAITVPCPPAGAVLPSPGDQSADPPGEAAPPQSVIVVVEDDADLLDLLQQLLIDAGHSVRGAPDAQAAMALIAGGAIRPDLLLTDYNLPANTTGVDLLTDLRALLQQALPAIVLTGDISTEAIARITNADCIRMNKPVEPKALLAVIERLCPAVVAPAIAPHPDAARATIHVIDDEPQVRDAIRDVLISHGHPVADFASAEAFLAAYRPGAAGALLVDAHLPGLSGVGLLDALRARGDHVPVVMITGDGDIGLAVAAMRAGACEFIEKPVGHAALLASIARATAQSRDIRRHDEAHAEAARRVADLTVRQREVMGMVLAGHPSKNIAADLGISQRTVENHRAEIMHRMGVKSIPELARKVVVAEP